ncbi:unnamed protein product [Caenorhabditis bovis]|uniref:PHD-type domain-containing protein n=1 Tax=Caenorhabditis bovis TaxID=2654633 RepID=A0A8S1E973_9PELO|nr:unnamed protein product [Caenorhabditis bovis]
MTTTSETSQFVEDTLSETNSMKTEEKNDEVESIDESTNEAGDLKETPAPVSSRRETVNKNVYIMMDVNHKSVEPCDVIEYEWPFKSGDRWFLQEQIGELLDIKSFSRKFPEFTRRKVNHEEREYLETQFRVNNLLNETQLRDMTAMRSTEIHELMSSDYPTIYMEYKKVVSSREREIAVQKAKEMEAIKNDAVKLAELRKKALNSAVEFNKELQNARRTERAHFWDIQTNVIQSRCSRWKKLTSEATKPHPYAAALIPGQYQHYYKRFTKEELDRLPLNTLNDSRHLLPINREPSPPPLNVAEQDALRVQQLEESRSDNTLSVEMKPLTDGDAKKCETCAKSDGQLLECKDCHIILHPHCIEMPEKMAAIVRTYEWSCVDCKLCSVCLVAEREDCVIFCDRCDRGFHTYCVNLDVPPAGTWICSNYCEDVS